MTRQQSIWQHATEENVERILHSGNERQHFTKFNIPKQPMPFGGKTEESSIEPHYCGHRWEQQKGVVLLNWSIFGNKKTVRNKAGVRLYQHFFSQV